jgi:hypothetical protein
VFILLISYLYSKISLINNNSNNFKLSILEEKFYISDDRNIYDELIAKSNEIQKNKTTIIVINQFIIVCSVTILNNFSNINSFQFVLFSTIYYFILFNQFNNFLNHLTSDRLEYRKYASSYNYLKKQISKELIKSNNEKNDG